MNIIELLNTADNLDMYVATLQPKRSILSRRAPRPLVSRTGNRSSKLVLDVESIALCVCVYDQDPTHRENPFNPHVHSNISSYKKKPPKKSF